MNKISILADNIFSPLGSNTNLNIDAILRGESGITQHPATKNLPFDYFGSKIPEEQIALATESFKIKDGYTALEKMCLASVCEAIKNIDLDLSSPDVGFVISTTKGNIDLLSEKRNEQKGKYLYTFGKRLSTHFKNQNKPIVISNACISGVLAIITAKRLLSIGQFKHIVVIGADLISEFTLSGFHALKAMSSERCKPFDKNRKGINLGEAATCMILSVEKKGLPISICGGASSNDANHISGPSRTGAGMIEAIKSSFDQVENFEKENIDFISAHGTGTLYNDEMEARAISHFDLNTVPLNSLKGYYGHTLGAAGVLESVLSYHSMLRNTLFESKGYSEIGTTEEINVLHKHTVKNDLKWVLKTASGFGGCNASLLFKKMEVA